jgi:hypothetical protein
LVIHIPVLLTVVLQELWYTNSWLAVSTCFWAVTEICYRN